MAIVPTSFHTDGFVVITDAFPADQMSELAERMDRVERAIEQKVGVARLAEANDIGILRLMLAFDAGFAELLTNPTLLAVVDELLGPTAILHLQNGLVVRPGMTSGDRFGFDYHPDFPRYLNGYFASVNLLVAVDEFTAANGATRVVAGSHQTAQPLSSEAAAAAALPVECAPGSLVVFDSTLLHAAGPNSTGRVRRAINHQFTRPWIKQQIDYVRALGDDAVLALPDRTQQLLGWYSRVVTSLDEYYLPADQRLYRSGQG